MVALNASERSTAGEGLEEDSSKFKLEDAVLASGSQMESWPSWKRITIKSARRRTLCFASRLDTWNFTVRSEIFNWLAISLLERFCRRGSKTSFSLRLKVPGVFVRAAPVFRLATIDSTNRDSTARGTQ